MQPAHTKDSLVSRLARLSSLQVDPSGTEVLQRGEFDLSLGLRGLSPTESGRTALVLRFVVEVVGLVAGATRSYLDGEHKFNGEFCRNLLTKRYGK